MHPWGKTSIWGSLAGIALLFLTLLPYTFNLGFYKPLSNTNLLVISGLHGICFFGLFYCLERIFSMNSQPILAFQVLRRSFFLGWTFSIGILLVWRDLETPFGIYMCVMSVFHYSEFLVTSIINPTTLSMDSFLLNHSKAYGIAAVASWSEYFLESFIFPSLKMYRTVMFEGLVLCILGELIRKAAMFTAWSNFTHIVRDRKVEGHELVTSGFYSMFRHPSYAGWFWWSIGTQVLLMNPFCTVGYTLASWKFFSERIYYEEATLLGFFGSTYVNYQSQVRSTGVPFVKGYELTD